MLCLLNQNFILGTPTLLDLRGKKNNCKKLEKRKTNWTDGKSRFQTLESYIICLGFIEEYCVNARHVVKVQNT